MPRLTKRSGDRSGISTTSRIFSIWSLQPPTSEYVTSGLSSTVIMVTEGSILGGSGRRISYLLRSTPTLIPSSMSVGEMRSPSLTTNLAICLTLMTYLDFSASFSSWMILVHRATWRGWSSDMRCRSAGMSHRCGGARPVSDSWMKGSVWAFLMNRDKLGPYLHAYLFVHAGLFFFDLLL